jgi:hypothetical protein
MRTGQRICAVVFCVAASGSVRADETGTGKAVFYGVAGAAAGIFDVGFTAYDLTHLSSVDSIPRSVGIVEVAGALPQVGVAIYVAMNPPPTAGVRGLSVAWAVWASLLSAHGIWVIASGKSPDANPALAPRAALSRCLDPSLPLPEGRQQTMIWSMVRRF